MTHKPLHTLVVLLMMLLMASTVQAGKVYKWADPDGSIHYSQTPPPGHHAREMNVDVPTPPTSDADSATDKEGDAAQKPAETKQAGKDQAEQQAALEKKNEEIRKENCKRANQRFRTINAGGRMYEVDEHGERVYWDDAKRASELAEAQKLIEEWCKED